MIAGDTVVVELRYSGAGTATAGTVRRAIAP